MIYLPEAPLMAETAHLSNNQHYQFKKDLSFDFDDQITWELPRSSQPWPETIPGSHPDPPRVGIQHASSLDILT